MKIQPPGATGGSAAARYRGRVRCPWCGSTSSRLKSLFGGTVSEILFQCEACRTPFGVMKWETLDGIADATRSPGERTT